MASRTDFVAWDSQPLDDWAPVHPPGYMVKLDGRRTNFLKNSWKIYLVITFIASFSGGGNRVDSRQCNGLAAI